MKKNVIAILILLFSFETIYSQSGWFNLNATFGGYGIYFKDVNTGLVSLFKTTNGGLNWIYTGGGGYMSFPNQNTGYATGSGYIYKTTNLGDNWITQENPVPGNLYGISFPTVNTGYACGEFSHIIKTTNGGNNWINLSSSLLSWYSLLGVTFLDSITGYIAGTGNGSIDTSIVLKTTNGGINWSIYRFNFNFDLSSIFFINANTGIIGGGGLFGIYKTTNAGVNWISINSPTANVINSLYFSSPNIGYGVCNYGDIIKTTDGGWMWFKQTPVTGNQLYSVFFINDNTGYASGTNAVLKTTNGGGPPIGIEPISTDVPEKFILYQNYPNPFNPVTKIKFEIPAVETTRRVVSTKIAVYDVLGEEAAILINAQLSPGTYEVEWDASAYPSGVYFYRLESGSFIETRKMVLLK